MPGRRIGTGSEGEGRFLWAGAESLRVSGEGGG